MLKQLVAWVGIDAFFAGVSAYFKKHSWATPTSRPARRARDRQRPRPLGWSGLWLETAGVNTLRPEIETDDAGAITSFAVLQSATAEHPTHPPAPPRHRVLQPHGRQARARPPRRARRRRRAHRGRRARRPDAPRPRAAQRRRPRLRQDPPRRAVARRRIANLSDDRGPARPCARVGSVWDATRDAETRGARLRRPRARQHRDRDRVDDAPHRARERRARGERVHRARAARRGARSARRRLWWLAQEAGAGQRRAVPVREVLRRDRRGRVARRRPRRALDGRARSRASRSTPISAGSC